MDNWWEQIHLNNQIKVMKKDMSKWGYYNSLRWYWVVFLLKSENKITNRQNYEMCCSFHKLMTVFFAGKVWFDVFCRMVIRSSEFNLKVEWLQKKKVNHTDNVVAIFLLLLNFLCVRS